MRRRDLITLLGGAAAWPVVARAQDKPLPVIGWLSASADDYKNLTVPFFRVLKETGYVEGQNMAVEYRWAEINTIGCRLLQPISSAAALR